MGIQFEALLAGGIGKIIADATAVVTISCRKIELVHSPIAHVQPNLPTLAIRLLSTFPLSAPLCLLTQKVQLLRVSIR